MDNSLPAFPHSRKGLHKKVVIFYIVCLYFSKASRTKRIRVLVGERTAANLGKGATHEITKDFGVFDLCCFFNGIYWSSRVCSAVPSAGHRGWLLCRSTKRNYLSCNSSFTLYALLNLTWNQFQPDRLVENSYPFYTSAAHFRAERPRLLLTGCLSFVNMSP